MATGVVLPPTDGEGPLWAPFGLDVPGEVADSAGKIQLRSLMFSERHQDGGVRLLISADFTRPALNPVPIPIIVGLPFGAGNISSCEGATGSDKLDCRIEGGQLTIDGAIGGSPATESGIVAIVFLRDTPGVGWRDAHSKVLVNLPSYFSTNPLDMRSPLQVRAEYGIPGLNNLSWSGPQPVVWSHGTATWSYTGNTYDRVPGPVTAVKEGVGQRDSFRTFVAGALIGLASATFVEALSEV